MDVTKLNQMGWKAVTVLKDGVAAAYGGYLKSSKGCQ